MDESTTTTLDDVIDSLLDQMISYDGHTREFTVMVTNLAKLHDLKPQPQTPIPAKRWTDGLTADLVVPAAVNILGIILILKFERLGVVTSKALGLVSKIRL